ncbi:MAG: hypothetical protein WC792_05400 [Candidatus Micrarchaeia archaeon]
MKKLFALLLFFALFAHFAHAESGLSCPKSDPAAGRTLSIDVYKIEFYGKKLAENRTFSENVAELTFDQLRERYADAFRESLLLRACGDGGLKGAEKRAQLDRIPAKQQVIDELNTQLQVKPKDLKPGLFGLTSRVQAGFISKLGLPGMGLAAPEAMLLHGAGLARELVLIATAALHQHLSGARSMGEEFLDFWGYNPGAGTHLAGVCYDPGMNAMLDKYMAQNGLYDRGFDKELVLALMMTESGCENDKSNGQGIMQVEACESMGCSLEQNIDMGTQHLAGDYDYAVAMGASGGEIPNLIFFGYNRGKGSEQLAMTLYQEGVDLKSAMNQACLSNFDASLCEGDGLGMHYPERVAQYYSGAT